MNTPLKYTTICTHPSYMCSAERRGADYVLVCPCGHVRVCVGDIEAMIWARVDQTALARAIRDENMGDEAAWTGVPTN